MFQWSGAHRDLHSFPTRRSSELAAYDPLDPATSRPEPPAVRPAEGHPWCYDCRSAIAAQRSEEHTSELQSRENLVCRLLLEKKKPRISRSPVDHTKKDRIFVLTP